MAPHKKWHLEPHRQEIASLLSSGTSQKQILEHLNKTHGLHPSQSSFKRTLSAWRLTSVQFQSRPDPESGILVSKIDEYFNRHYYKDRQIVEAVKLLGIKSSVEQVKRIRLKRRWMFRIRSRNPDGKQKSTPTTTGNISTTTTSSSSNEV